MVYLISCLIFGVIGAIVGFFISSAIFENGTFGIIGGLILGVIVGLASIASESDKNNNNDPYKQAFLQRGKEMEERMKSIKGDDK
ncbi:MAG: hypothetical protein LBC86_11265 [Oscillospiraceae bacterium]|jgi:F0F1-type ATP synthase assembly protein I|nr:hypothetical protein [Oscillospiraceae bacterium]